MPNGSCRVYAAVNQKGGVGKSNLSTNLGIGLARKGQRVLIVDLDSQASQTVSLGWKNPDELNVTVATQLEQVMSGKAFDPHDGILHHAEGVHLLPSSIALSRVEMRLVNAMSRELTLKKCLAPIKSEYDVILLDCPPTLGMMTINALAAADSVIVPVQPEYLSVIGMTQLFETIGLVKENINPDLRVEGVLITLANMRTNLAKNTVEIIKNAYGGNVRVYPEPIPYSTKVKEAGAAGKSIFAYDSKGKAAFAYREILEKGVSGFKVSAEKRDAIQEIQQEALEKKFDVLLVFMFDRLGRRDDETPFVVEWFVKQGIEVWSVKEGEQRFESHVDKLTNYIRYWQASGESIKTSIRTKTRLSQIVEEGYFRGGSAPYGYRLEKQGRFNKRNHEVFEIFVDEQESKVVKKIFDLYITQGMGSQRISTFLTEQGVFNRKGINFTNCTIANMLKNRTYLGVLRSGETESKIFEHLQIIEPHIFDIAQKIREQRSADYAERRVPLNTKGSSLLSGNIFCGHCGARMTITTNGKKYHRKDGEVTITPRTRYVCYNRTRHKHLCDGQTGYTVRKLDAVIDKVVHTLFERLNDVPKETVIAERYADRISEYQMKLTRARATLGAHTAEVKEYEAEVIKVIRGESKLSSELLSKIHDEAKVRMEEAEQIVRDLEQKLENSEKMRNTLAEQYDEISGWAELYDTCDIAAKKMIVSRMMKEVRVMRDYEIEIDLTVDCEALGISPEEGIVFKESA